MLYKDRFKSGDRVVLSQQSDALPYPVGSLAEVLFTEAQTHETIFGATEMEMPIIKFDADPETKWSISGNGLLKIGATKWILVEESKRVVKENFADSVPDFQTLEEVEAFLRKHSDDNCGMWKITAIPVDGGESKSYSWLEWYKDEDGESETDYYFIMYVNNGQLRGSFGPIGYYWENDLRAACNYATELAWKSGEHMAAVSFNTEFICFLAPPGGTPKGGILQHEMNTFGQSMGEDEE